MWHIRSDDRRRLAAELKNLDAQLLALNEKIGDAKNRQRYGGPADVARGADELERLLAELDRLMTRERAVEAKLLILQRRDAARGPERLTVEVHRDVTERGAG